MRHTTMQVTVFSASLAALLTVGCKDPAESVPAATLAAATSQSAKAPAAPAYEPETFTLTTANTRIEFVGSKVTGSHEGGFKKLSGTVAVDPDDLSRASAEITIDMASAYTDTEKLTGHLLSPDFFDVAKYPTATFKILSATPLRSKEGTHTLSGELTLHGVTKAISFPASVAVAKGSIKANAEFSINRKDFGILYPGMKDDLIRDGVVLKLEVNATRNES